MTDQQLFDHPIPVETPLGHKCHSTPATQARWQFLRTKPKGAVWQEGVISIGSTTLGTMTFTSGTAAGSVFPMIELSGLGVGCSEGDVIRFTSDGGSADATVPVTFTAVLRRGQ